MDTINPKQVLVDALTSAKGNIFTAAVALGLSKDALRLRLKRRNIDVSKFIEVTEKSEAVAESASTPAGASPVHRTKKAAKPKATNPKATKTKATKTPAAKTARAPGTVIVRKGAKNIVRVPSTHVGAVAVATTKKLGGSCKPVGAGLKMFDGEGRLFATMLTRKGSADFYVSKVPLKVAIKVAGYLGTWTNIWPVSRRGSATLRFVETVTKALIKTLMRLAASHGVDGRTKTK